MVRVHAVKKARVDQDNCERCGARIVRGDAYFWMKPRFDGKRVRCAACKFRRSEFAAAPLSAAYAALEHLEDYLPLWSGSLEDLRGELTHASDAILGVSQESAAHAESLRLWAVSLASLPLPEFEGSSATIVSWRAGIVSAVSSALEACTL